MRRSPNATRISHRTATDARLCVKFSKQQLWILKILLFGKTILQEVSRLTVEVKEQEKRVNIWLTRAESGDEQLRKSLKPLYREYKAKRFLVAVFVSGSEDLEELTLELLRYNRVRLRELEAIREKA